MEKQAIISQQFCCFLTDSVNRVTGRTDSDWEIKYESTELRSKRGHELLQSGNTVGIPMSVYARGMTANGGGRYSHRVALAYGSLGLDEDIDEVAKRAIGMVDGGYDALSNRNYHP